jgi:hypothetical protein
MGIPLQDVRRPYAPPPESYGVSGSSANQTFLSGSDPDLVRVSDDVQMAQRQQPLPNRSTGPTGAKDTSALAGPNPSNLYLKFDGRYLRLYDRDQVVAEWPGVSGKENFGSGKNQDKKDYGPIPEGTYDIKQDRYQTISAWNTAAGIVGRGEWPGSVRGWGTERVWADPTPETEKAGLAFGRKDMAIHGGWSPGRQGAST